MLFNPDTRHKLYDHWQAAWRRQRDVCAGDDAMKSSPYRENYLPRLSGQPDATTELLRKDTDHPIATYDEYSKRAIFTNATGRTKDGMVGAVLRKAAEIHTPGLDDDELDSIGFNLESFDEVMFETLDEAIGIGRYGHLVDMGAEGGDPYISSYFAESITDWELGIVPVTGAGAKGKRGRKQVVRVNLLEKSGIPHSTEQREMKRFRILRLGQITPVTDEEAETTVDKFLEQHSLRMEDFVDGPIYFQEIWQEVEVAASVNMPTASRWVRVGVIVPRMQGGKLWREIPFTFFNTISTRAKPEKPSLLDIAVVNIGHYRNSADHEHGLHFTGLPQPWASGFKFTGNSLPIGSTAAWVTEEPNAKAGYLEFTGQGLGALERALEKKSKQMAALGARLLEEQPDPGSTEAAETVKFRHSGDHSVLSRLSMMCSEGLTRDLRFIAMFRGVSNVRGISCKMNLDFGTEGLSPAMLQALMLQVQNGLMSWDTYTFNCSRGELYADGWNNEKEAAAIEAGPPGRSLDKLLNPMPDVPAGPGGDKQMKPKTAPKKPAPRKRRVIAA